MRPHQFSAREFLEETGAFPIHTSGTVLALDSDNTLPLIGLIKSGARARAHTGASEWNMFAA
jgi:hypothetical protein